MRINSINNYPNYYKNGAQNSVSASKNNKSTSDVKFGNRELLRKGSVRSSVIAALVSLVVGAIGGGVGVWVYKPNKASEEKTAQVKTEPGVTEVALPIGNNKQLNLSFDKDKKELFSWKKLRELCSQDTPGGAITYPFNSVVQDGIKVTPFAEDKGGTAKYVRVEMVNDEENTEEITYNIENLLGNAISLSQMPETEKATTTGGGAAAGTQSNDNSSASQNASQSNRGAARTQYNNSSASKNASQSNGAAIGIQNADSKPEDAIEPKETDNTNPFELPEENEAQTDDVSQGNRVQRAVFQSASLSTTVKE